ncbi:MAG: hypothetical protein LJE67_10555 [Salaquimonas sp.]|jgi:hypothetical protein|nr:hypothetical protein [Salaquimonas sp.]
MPSTSIETGSIASFAMSSLETQRTVTASGENSMSERLGLGDNEFVSRQVGVTRNRIVWPGR